MSPNSLLKMKIMENSGTCLLFSIEKSPTLFVLCSLPVHCDGMQRSEPHFFTRNIIPYSAILKLLSGGETPNELTSVGNQDSQ